MADEEVDVLEKAWKKQFLDDTNFPEWTKSEMAITAPLQLPEKESNLRGLESVAPCLLCDETFGIPSKQNDFLKHLLEQHSLVIGDVNLITDLPSYVQYWKTKFISKDVSDFCSVIRASVTENENKRSKSKKKAAAAEGGGGDGKEEERDFFLLSDVLQEDKDLRIQLQMKRLEEVLSIQERERKDTTFKRTCLFCRTVFEGNHATLLDHMSVDHNFNVGQPNNLVFVKELLDLLEEKMNTLCCIFCDKLFKTREVLKEHMRKKGHKRLNPRNSIYDKFYLVNYREFGKTWSSSASNDFEEDELPSGFESDESGDYENDWSDWKGDQAGAVCLFCAATYPEINDLLNHMTSIHDFDFQDIRNCMKLSFYQQVKLINYIRRQVHLNRCIYCSESGNDREDLMRHMTEKGHLKVPEDREEWNQAQYYFPTYENDNLLSYLDDDVYESSNKEEETKVVSEDLPEALKTSLLNSKEFRDSICSTQRRERTLKTRTDE